MKNLKIILSILYLSINVSAFAGKDNGQLLKDVVNRSDILCKITHVLEKMNEQNATQENSTLERFKSQELNPDDQSKLTSFCMTLLLDIHHFREHCERQAIKIMLHQLSQGRKAHVYNYDEDVEKGLKDLEKQKINLFIKQMTHPNTCWIYAFLPSSWWCYDVDQS